MREKECISFISCIYFISTLSYMSTQSEQANILYDVWRSISPTLFTLVLSLFPSSLYYDVVSSCLYGKHHTGSCSVPHTAILLTLKTLTHTHARTHARTHTHTHTHTQIYIYLYIYIYTKTQATCPVQWMSSFFECNSRGWPIQAR